MNWLLFAVAVVAGAFLPTQAGVNAQLAKNLEHSLLIGAIFLIVGVVLIQRS